MGKKRCHGTVRVGVQNPKAPATVSQMTTLDKTEYVYAAVGLTTTEQNDQPIERCILEFLPKQPSKILELGCGNGHFANLLAQTGHEVVASDDSASGIAVAKNNYSGVRFEHASCYTPIESEKFDVVIAKEVIEHLVAPRRLCETAYSALKPGGQFIVTTPYHGYLKNLVLALAGKGDAHYNPAWEGGHIKFFSPASLSMMLKQAGFTDCTFKYAGRFAFLWKSMICQATRPA